MDVEAFIEERVQTVPNVIERETADHLDGFIQAAEELGLQITDTRRKLRLIRDGLRPIGSMNGMLTSLTSWRASGICRNKHETLRRLTRAGVPAPRSRAFSSFDGHAAALAYFRRERDRDRRLVVKPVDGRAGWGISVDVPDEDAFDQAWAEARACSHGQGGAVLVEDYLPGVDLRVIVVNGRFECAATRIPPYVVGDGHSSVQALIAEKNRLRSRHPHHGCYPIVPDETTETHRLPLEGEVVIVNPRCNIHQGGEAFDVTDQVSDRIRAVAAAAARTIPGLGVAGVDLIADPKLRDGHVIEINSLCNFCVHYYPYFGKSRNPARVILEAMRDSPQSLLRMAGNLSGHWSARRKLGRLAKSAGLRRR